METPFSNERMPDMSKLKPDSDAVFNSVSLGGQTGAVTGDVRCTRAVADQYQGTATSLEVVNSDSSAYSLIRPNMTQRGQSHHWETYGTTPVEKLTLTNSGRLGIGTTTPDAPLNIEKSETFTSGGHNFPAVSTVMKQSSTNPALIFGTEGGNTPYITDGDGDSVNTPGLLIKEREHDRMYFTRGGGIKVSTNFGTPSSPYTMFMFGNGGHHIDSYSSTGRDTIGSGYPMHINVNAFQNIVVRGITNLSDDRIKEDEQFIENATDTLLKLRPQTYNIYPPEISGNTIVADHSKPSSFESGLIAQEVYYDAPELRHIVTINDLSGNKIIPSSDDPSEDPNYSDWGNMAASINYTEIIPFLIKSNQEQQAEIEELKARILALENN